MARKQEIIQFEVSNHTDCGFDIPLGSNNPSINATRKFKFDLGNGVAVYVYDDTNIYSQLDICDGGNPLACGTWSITINDVVYAITFNQTLAGAIAALNALGFGLFCFETTATTTTTTTTSTTTSTTTAAPIVTPIEDFGADPLYILRYAQFDVTPIVGEGKSLITYTGADNIFQADFVTRQVQFVLFNGHFNPAGYPANGVVNGNYAPSETTARYSFVTDYIDGKNVKVDFVYNGGNRTTPQAQTNGSGYFFIDNRAAFRAAFHQNSTRNVAVSLQAGKTYVTKGGWNSEISKALTLVSNGANANKPAIKISMEDAFSVTPTPEAYGSYVSFSATYNSPYFFVLTTANTGMDIVLESIDILPPHYCVASAQYVNGYLYVPFFANYYNSVGGQRASLNKIYNSNGQLEQEYIQANPVPSLTRQPNFVMHQFAYSNNGGVLNGGGTDVGAYQEFMLENSNYQTIQFHNIKFQNVNGNLLRVKGATLESPTNIVISDVNNVIQAGITYNVQLVNDGTGKKRTVRNDTLKSWYVLANQYWYGSQAASDGAALSSSRYQYCTVQNAGVTYYIFLANQAQTIQAYAPSTPQNSSANGAASIANPAIINSTDCVLYEEVPVAGVSSIVIDGTINKKVNDTQFDIYGWGLQGTTTYPMSDTNATLYTIPVGDVINYLGTDYTIISRKRIVVGRSDVTPRQGVGGWRITLSAPITDANPTFGVTTSRTEFLADGNFHALTAYYYAVGGYFCYSSISSNFIFENMTFNGFGRFTEPDIAAGWNINTPLYQLTKYQQFINAFFNGGNEMDWQGAGGRGLQWRNTITGVDTNRVLIDGGRLWWQRLLSLSNIVELRNVPTLISGGPYGETRLLDPILDGLGLVIEDSASFNFTGIYASYPMTNIYVKKVQGTNQGVSVWGTGVLDISGFTTDLFTAPSTYRGIEYFRASSFTGSTCALTITGNNGRCGFRPAGIFSENTLILTNWTLVTIPFAGGGWNASNGTGWPVTPTPPVPPNFSIT